MPSSSLNGTTTMRFEPIPCIALVNSARAPEPRETRRMTKPAPMMTPSIVSPDLSLLALSEFSAVRKLSSIFKAKPPARPGPHLVP